MHARARLPPSRARISGGGLVGGVAAVAGYGAAQVRSIALSSSFSSSSGVVWLESPEGRLARTSCSVSQTSASASRSALSS